MYVQNFSWSKILCNTNETFSMCKFEQTKGSLFKELTNFYFLTTDDSYYYISTCLFNLLYLYTVDSHY